jgi:hypothetical protein
MPLLDAAFFDQVRNAFMRAAPSSTIMTFGVDGDWTGHAWAISCAAQKTTSYALVGSEVYPVAVLRPSGHLDVGDGLDENWPVPSGLDGRLMKVLANHFEPICTARGYALLDLESPAIQQRLRFGWFGRAKAWDYLFYLGVPTA